MSLTGPWTIATLAILAAATPALALLLWNRLPHSPVIVWPARALMLLTCQLTACLLVGGLLNDYGQFYTSWSELFGHDPKTTVRSLKQPLEANIEQQIRAEHLPPGSSAIVWLPVREAGLQQVQKAAVYLPAAYLEPQYRDRQFPVVELLDGYPGSPLTWLKVYGFRHAADTEITAGRTLPFIAVMPVQNYVPRRDRECLNIPGGAQVETTLTTNVRSAVLANLRVSPDARNWALMGASTGGYCAMNLAMRHPQWYSTVASIAGYTHPFQDLETGPIFVGRDQFRKENDPLWRLQHLPTPQLSMLLFSTKTDRMPYEDALTFARYVKPPMTMSELFLNFGGHNFHVLGSAVPVCLDWISAHIGAPLALSMTLDGQSPHLVTPMPADHTRGPLPLAGGGVRR